ncbi:MAG TPA: ATP-binding protein [Rhizomicrobium sp.]|nr:ATP-binding protein [Rhizomicrobium sp.]
MSAIVRSFDARKKGGQPLSIVRLGTADEGARHFHHLASHDMQEHLRMVLAFNRVLAEEYGPKLDNRARHCLSLSLEAASQMRDLLDDLRAYEKAKGVPSNVLFDAQAELERVRQGLELSIRETGTRIATDRLPRLWGNAVRFRRLMQNLLSNAIKYVPRGTSPAIRIRVADRNEVWRICVADNGIGIDPAHFGSIFQPFRRLHARTRYRGSGLGLTICEQIVTGFGGHIWVKSAPGAGASFFFTVPKTGAQ